MTEQVENVEKQEVVKQKGKYLIKLDTPLDVNGTEIKEIELNLKDLTGKDIIKMEKELFAEGNQFGFDSFWNQKILIKIASKASGILTDDLINLSAQDFVAVTFVVRNFYIKQ